MHKSNIKISLMILLFIISFEISYSIHEINITLKGKGVQKIFRYKDCNVRLKEILVNNILIQNKNIFQDNEYILINITEEYNSITFTSMGRMFQDCTSLVSVNFKDINTKENFNMGCMFANCYKLVSLDLSNFITNKVEYMDNVFLNCYSLTCLNLTNFDTSSVIQTEKMFENCTLLKSLDLSNFDTSKNSNMEYMFKNCKSLTSLNLSNFNFYSFLNDAQIVSMFYNCSKLNYINIKNYKIKSMEKHKIIEQIISNTTKNLTICINGGDINEDLKSRINTQYCPTFNCEENYYLEQTKLIEENSIYVNDYNSTQYIYEYENKSYNITQDIIINNNKTKCDIKDFFIKGYKNNFKSQIEVESFKNDIIESIKNGSLSDLLYQVLMNDTNYIIKEGNEKYQISTLNNQMKMDSEITAINFTGCEKILKEKYGIESEELIILKNCLYLN